MPQFVAFLRAINIGGRTVKMERLRELFTSAGYANVKTFIASGNVLFDATRGESAQLEGSIETLLRETLGFEVTTFVRTAAALEEVAAYKPFPHARVGNEKSELFVGFLKTRPTSGTHASIVSLGGKMDELHIEGTELYWLCRTRMSDSPVSGALLERKLGMRMTLRNARTVAKIAAVNSMR